MVRCPHIGECEQQVTYEHYEKFCEGEWEKCEHLKKITRRPIEWKKLKDYGGE